MAISPHIEYLRIQYGQDTDACDETRNSVQTLDIECINAGGGHYLVIETERWAIDETDIEGFSQRLRDVLAMARKA